MIGAAQPRADDRANYVFVAEHRESKGEPRPTKLSSTVFSLYDSYITRLGEAGGPKPHPFSVSDMTVLTENADCLVLSRFRDLRRDILMSAPTGKCAYCYQLKAHEVDHYLPKSKFGEYSIYSPNLVPICTICNGKKSNRYAREGGGRRYVHPYNDYLSGTSLNVLAGDVRIGDSVTVSYKLVRPDGIDDDFWTTVLSQFEDLKLLTRYADEAAENMAGNLPVFYAHFQRGGAEELRYQISLVKNAMEDQYGANHWWTALYTSLFKSDEFWQGGFMALGPNRGLSA